MRLGKRLYQLSPIAIVFCLIIGCAGSRGKGPSGPYTSPHGNFVVPVPAMGLFGGTTIQDGSDEHGGRVAFHDDLGYINSITYQRLPDGFDIEGDAVEREAACRGFLHDYALPALFRQVDTGAKVLFEETVGENATPEYFAIVMIPEGSTLEDLTTGKRMDSTRALLIFPRGGYMYMLGYASGLLSDDSIDKFKIDARKSIDEFRATIVFQ